MNAARSQSTPLVARLLTALSDRALSQDAKQRATQLDIQRLEKTVDILQKKKLRKKSTIEKIRAEEGSGALFIGPEQWQRYQTLQAETEQRRHKEAGEDRQEGRSCEQEGPS